MEGPGTNGIERYRLSQAPPCPMSAVPFSQPCPPHCSWPYPGTQAEATLGCSGGCASPDVHGSEGLVQPDARAAAPSSLLLTPLGRALGLSHGWGEVGSLGRQCVPQPACAPLCCPALLAASLALLGAARECLSPGALPPARGVGAAPSQGCPSCWLRH